MKMDRLADLKVGDKVIIRYINDAIRYIKDRSINNIAEWTRKEPCEVTKITKKYVTVKFTDTWEEKFDREFDYVQKVNRGSANYKLYRNLEEIILEEQANDLYYKVKKTFFDSWNRPDEMTLEKLERVAQILELD